MAQAALLPLRLTGTAGFFGVDDMGRLEQMCRDTELLHFLWELICRRRWILPQPESLVFQDEDEVVWKQRVKRAIQWDSRLFACGLHGPDSERYFRERSYTPLPFAPELRFSSVSDGESHFIALAGDAPEPSSHRVFAWGYYRLTHDDLHAGATPAVPTRMCRAPSGLHRGVPNRLPTRVPGFEQTTPERAITRNGSSAVISGGRLYMFGASAYGLGRATLASAWTERPHPTIVGLPGGVRAAMVSLGTDHALVADASGVLFAFGEGGLGRLGLGHTATISTPSRVAALKGTRVVGVAAGMKHSVVLTANGEVWAFGDNSRLQIGRPDVPYAVEPHRVLGTETRRRLLLTLI